MPKAKAAALNALTLTILWLRHMRRWPWWLKTMTMIGKLPRRSFGVPFS